MHPELEPAEALDTLWDEIVHVLRLDSDDPVEAWRERMETIVASADRMTERRFDALHLQGPGTDLTIGLLPSSRWLGADFTTVDGLTHYPNLPTEEVFTTPDPERVDGHVSATMPLELYGSYMDGIRIEFEGGRAVKADADRAPTRSARPSRRTTAPHASARSRSSTRRAGSARSAPSSTRRCWTRTRPATSRSGTPTPSRSRTRPTASA